MAFLDKAGLERLWAHIVSLVGTKVEKEDGKGLSTEDFTTEEKEKLASIAEGATNTIIVDNVTSTSATEALSAAQGKYLNDRMSAITGSMEDLGGGDMMKATYDADNDGIVDQANHALTAGSATFATKDASGNVITSTYETKADANVKLDEAKTYADNAATAVKNDLLNGAGTAYDTLKELGDLIDDNTDAIGALETVAAGKADVDHTHAIADVNGLQSALDGKAASSHGTHVSYSTTAPVMDGTASVGTASTVARSDHRHPTDTSRASQTDLDALETVVGNKADKTHTHTIANVTNLQSELDGKVSATDVTMKVYKNITDIGMTTASTFADVVAAVPMQAVIYIAAGALTDTSWNLPVTYGVIEIIRKGETQVAIRLHGRVGRVWIAATTTAGVPTGEWNELVRESTLNSELAKKIGNSGDQEITSGSLKITSAGDTALRLDKTIDDSNYVREYMILEADRARVGFGTNGGITNQMSLYSDRTELTKPLSVSSGGTGASTAAGALTNLGVTATAAELNKLDGVTATTVELNYVDGVTSNIQTQLNAKQATITGGATTIASSDLTASRALISNSSGKVAVSAVTSTELGYLDGVTSAIQAQLDGKQATVTGAASSIVSSDFSNTDTVLISNSSGKVSSLSGVTKTELQTLQGVTSNIQTQLDGKQASITGAISNVLNKDFTASRALVSQSSGKIGVSATTSTELDYLSGVTSKVQDQLDGKVSKSGDTMTNTLKMQHGSMSKGTAPSSGIGRYIQFVDNASTPNVMAYHGFYQGVSSSYYQIRAYNGLLTGTDNYAMFALGHNAANLPYCQVTSDSATFAASANGNVRNIQVQDASGTNVATGRIIMKRK